MFIAHGTRKYPKAPAGRHMYSIVGWVERLRAPINDIRVSALQHYIFTDNESETQLT